MKPYLRDFVPTSYDDIPEATAYEAGYLVTKNAGWRNTRPVLDETKCIGCLNCYLYCPDGVIFRESKFAGILSEALLQHHLLGFEIAQLEFHHLH